MSIIITQLMIIISPFLPKINLVILRFLNVIITGAVSFSPQARHQRHFQVQTIQKGGHGKSSY